MVEIAIISTTCAQSFQDWYPRYFTLADIPSGKSSMYDYLVTALILNTPPQVYRLC